MASSINVEAPLELRRRIRESKKHMAKGGRKYVGECLQREDRACATYSGIVTLLPIALMLCCYEASD
jgi:hypothetical protein